MLYYDLYLLKMFILYQFYDIINLDVISVQQRIYIFIL